MSQEANKERQVFADAVELPAERRAAFFKEACGTDGELFTDSRDGCRRWACPFRRKGGANRAIATPIAALLVLSRWRDAWVFERKRHPAR